MFQFAEKFVADVSFVAELYSGLGLDLQQLATEFYILIVGHGLREPVGAVVFIQAGQPGAIMLREIVIHFGQFWFGILTNLLKVLQCSLQYGASRLLFFGGM